MSKGFIALTMILCFFATNAFSESQVDAIVPEEELVSRLPEPKTAASHKSVLAGVNVAMRAKHEMHGDLAKAVLQGVTAAKHQQEAIADGSYPVPDDSMDSKMTDADTSSDNMSDDMMGNSTEGNDPYAEGTAQAEGDYSDDDSGPYPVPDDEDSDAGNYTVMNVSIPDDIDSQPQRDYVEETESRSFTHALKSNKFNAFSTGALDADGPGNSWSGATGNATELQSEEEQGGATEQQSEEEQGNATEQQSEEEQGNATEQQPEEEQGGATEQQSEEEQGGATEQQSEEEQSDEEQGGATEQQSEEEQSSEGPNLSLVTPLSAPTTSEVAVDVKKTTKKKPVTVSEACKRDQKFCAGDRFCLAAMQFMQGTKVENIKDSQWAGSKVHNKPSFIRWLRYSKSCEKISQEEFVTLSTLAKNKKSRKFRAVFFDNAHAIASSKPTKNNALSKALALAHQWSSERAYTNGARTPFNKASCHAHPRPWREIVIMKVEDAPDLDLADVAALGWGVSFDNGFSVSTPVGGVSVTSNGVGVQTPLGGISITDQGLSGSVGIPGIAEFKVSINNNGFSASADTIAGSTSLTVDGNGFGYQVKNKFFSYGIQMGPNGVNVNGEVNVFGIAGVSFEAGCGPDGCYGQGDAFFNPDCALFWMNMLTNPMKALDFRINPITILADTFNILLGIVNGAVEAIKALESIASCFHLRSIPDEFLECLTNSANGGFGSHDRLGAIIGPICDAVYNSEIVAQAVSAIANIKSFQGSCLTAVFDKDLLKWTKGFTLGIGTSASAGYMAAYDVGLSLGFSDDGKRIEHRKCYLAGSHGIGTEVGFDIGLSAVAWRDHSAIAGHSLTAAFDVDLCKMFGIQGCELEIGSGFVSTFPDENAVNNMHMQMLKCAGGGNLRVFGVSLPIPDFSACFQYLNSFITNTNGIILPFMPSTGVSIDSPIGFAFSEDFTYEHEPSCSNGPCVTPPGQEDANKVTEVVGLAGSMNAQKHVSFSHAGFSQYYIRTAGAWNFAHAHGGNNNGAYGTLHQCPWGNNHANCRWVFEASDTRPGHFYIRSSDQALYLHSAGGSHAGAYATLHACPKANNHGNCQWKFEPSTTRPGYSYIKSSDANLYLHSHGGSHGGAHLTLHACPKHNDHYNCQWKFYGIEFQYSIKSSGGHTNNYMRAASPNYIGCFVDDGHRDLKHGPRHYGYSPESCMRACGSYKFFALQNGGWCNCDNTHSSPSHQYPGRPDNECNQGGVGYGGPWRNAIYRTVAGIGTPTSMMPVVDSLSRWHIEASPSRPGHFYFKTATPEDLYLAANQYNGVNYGTFEVRNDPITSFAGWASTAHAKFVSGDFNADGKGDFALVGGSGWGSIPVAFSNGDGTYTVTNHGVTSFPGWAVHAQVVAGDFNGDGKSDLALQGPNWGSTPTAFSNGDGTFSVTNHANHQFAQWAHTAYVKVVAGDFDGNGKDDIALVGGHGWGTIPIAFSDSGNGHYRITNHAVTSFPTWANHAQIRSADINGDGFADLAASGPHGWGSMPTAFTPTMVSGSQETVEKCPKAADKPNCQWKLVASGTRSGKMYIKVADHDLYLHAHGGSHSGAIETLHPCPKGNDHYNCQWQLDEHPVVEHSDWPVGYCTLRGHDQNSGVVHLVGGGGWHTPEARAKCYEKCAAYRSPSGQTWRGCEVIHHYGCYVHLNAVDDANGVGGHNCIINGVHHS